MIEATIVLWGGMRDGEVLPLRAFAEHLPSAIEVLGRPNWEEAWMLGNCPRLPVTLYNNTGKIDHEGNFIFKMTGSREI